MTINQLVDMVSDIAGKTDRASIIFPAARRARTQLRQSADPREARLGAEPVAAQGARRYLSVDRAARARQFRRAARPVLI